MHGQHAHQGLPYQASAGEEPARTPVIGMARGSGRTVQSCEAAADVSTGGAQWPCDALR